MKRILVLSLALILAVSSMAVPSYAAESPWLEVLDYTTVFPSGNYFQTNGSSSFNVTLPFSMSLQYIDILASWSGSLFSSVYASWENGDSSPLTVVNLGNGLCRIYGYVPAYSYYSLGLTFNSPGITYSTILSMKVSSKALKGFDVPVSGYLSADGEWKDLYFSGSGESASAKITISTSSPSWFYSAGINFSNWQNYDFIDVAFSLYGAASINSLTARFDTADGDAGGSYIPIDFSHISESFYNDGNYEVVVRIDLTGVDRTTTDNLVLLIDGEHDGYEISFYISDVTGYVVPSYTDPDVHFLQKIWNAITSGFSSVGSWISSQTNSIVSYFQSLISNINTWAFDVEGHGLAWLVAQIRFKLNVIYDDFSGFFQSIINILNASGDSQGFQDEVDDQGDRLDQMDEALNSVTKPALDRVDTNISGIVSDTDLANTAHVYTLIIDDNIMAPALTMVTILAMMSFALFGKR